MSNAQHQSPENQGLLAEDREPGTSYRDDVHAEQQTNGLPPPGGSHEANFPIMKPENRKGDALGLGLVVGGCAFLIGITWFLIFTNNPKELGLFAYHPPLQTLAIAFFAFGILTLQPTSQPKTKVVGLRRHQLIILGLAFPCIAAGTIIIYCNKNLHEAPHFTSWHGTFGIISIAWLLIQVTLGVGSVWFGGAAFGGGAKAKAVWKYHRLSGYLLFPFFLITVHLAGAWSAWTLEAASQTTRVVGFVIAPLAIWVGVWSRARLSKMKFV